MLKFYYAITSKDIKNAATPPYYTVEIHFSDNLNQIIGHLPYRIGTIYILDLMNDPKCREKLNNIHDKLYSLAKDWVFYSQISGIK